MTSLKPVEVEDHDRRARGAAVGHLLERRRHLALQRGPVRQPRQRVVQRVVPQLVHQLAVLQRDAGVVGHRLEQPDVVLGVGADVPEPVGDDEDAEDAGAAAQGHGDRLAGDLGVEPPALVGVPRAAGDQERFAVADDAREQPLVRRRRRLRGASEPPGGAEPDVRDVAAVGGDEGDLGPLGVQQLPRLPQHVAQGLVDLGCAGDGLGEAVEPLGAQMPVGERRVGRGSRAGGRLR